MASISSSDLWEEIWKRLPPKSICRFRCVCKLWNSLLSSNFFIGFHHKFTSSTTPAGHKSYLLMPNYGNFIDLLLLQCTLYQPQEQQRGDGGVIRERATFLNLPYSTSPDDSDFECVCFHICGVVHGVVCLVSPRNIVLWNPMIRKHIYLWYDRTQIPSSVGLGFDAAKNDFKVVVVPHQGPLYQVFTVEQDCWRTESLGNLYRPQGHGCFINGTIYWLVEARPMLLLYDCEREEFKTMAFPPKLADEYRPQWSIFSTLSKHGGMLSLLVQVDIVEMGGMGDLPEYELWVMEEDEDNHHRRSWRNVVRLDEYLMSGHPHHILDPKNRIKLSSNSIPERLAMFDNQPIYSQLFEKTLFLMNAKSYPSPKQPLDCRQCSSFMYTNSNGSRNTLFQSRLL